MTPFNPNIKGPYGSITRGPGELRTVSLALSDTVTPGLVGQFRVNGNDWSPLPQGEFHFPLAGGDTLELKATWNNIDDSSCELATNTPTNAVFVFNWDDPHAPSVTIEAKEAPVMDNPIK